MVFPEAKKKFATTEQTDNLFDFAVYGQLVKTFQNVCYRCLGVTVHIIYKAPNAL